MASTPTTEKIVPYTLLGMTAVTGLVDAVSFLSLGRVFTANMTGNVVLLAFATARVSGLSIAYSLTALLSFLVGAIFGGRIMARAGADSQIRFVGQAFLLEVAFLFAASLCATEYRRDLLGHSFQLFALIALTALGADSSIANGNNPRLARRVQSVVAMFLGAALGAAIIRYSISAALWLGTVICALC